MKPLNRVHFLNKTKRLLYTFFRHRQLLSVWNSRTNFSTKLFALDCFLRQFCHWPWWRCCRAHNCLMIGSFIFFFLTQVRACVRLLELNRFSRACLPWATFQYFLFFIFSAILFSIFDHLGEVQNRTPTFLTVVAISWCTWIRLSWLYSHHTSCLFLVWAPHSDSFRITSNTFFRQFVVPSSHFLWSPFLCNHRNVAIDHDDANVCFPQVQVAVSTFLTHW